MPKYNLPTQTDTDTHAHRRGSRTVSTFHLIPHGTIVLGSAVHLILIVSDITSSCPLFFSNFGGLNPLQCHAHLLPPSSPRYRLIAKKRKKNNENSQSQAMKALTHTPFSFHLYPPTASVILPRTLRHSFCVLLCLHLKRARQRPITSPWQTSSALNSEPSSVR